jgi:hypothetical protein
LGLGAMEFGLWGEGGGGWTCILWAWPEIVGRFLTLTGPWHLLDGR